jgi:hypothetical protein
VDQTAVGVGAGLVLVAVVTGLAVQHSGGPVPRGRVRRFARRQALPVTAANGAQVIRYLAHTRRWRSAGVVVAVWCWFLTQLTGTTVSVNFAVLLGGWFTGALVAEARLVSPPAGPHRTASLRPRRPERYVGRLTWALPQAALVTAVVATAGATVLAGQHGWSYSMVAPPVIGIALAAATVVVRRRVLTRAQPPLPEDQLAADEAIRSRSLHVLCGTAPALVLLSVSWSASLGVDFADGAAPGSTLAVVSALAWLSALGIGWNVATARFAVRPGVPAVA